MFYNVALMTTYELIFAVYHNLNNPQLLWILIALKFVIFSSAVKIFIFSVETFSNLKQIICEYPGKRLCTF